MVKERERETEKVLIKSTREEMVIKTYAIMMLHCDRVLVD